MKEIVLFETEDKSITIPVQVTADTVRHWIFWIPTTTRHCSVLRIILPHTV